MTVLISGICRRDRSVYLARRFEIFTSCRDTRRGMTEMTMLTEFEENVSFDADDPDFAPPTTAVRNVLRARYFTDVKFDVGKAKKTSTSHQGTGSCAWACLVFIC
ncbi:hypothetical protein HN011_002085 [Eciton burchellii]|nr:hypothetical protein HN011_002085 [Eciton burchellii]